MVLYKPYVFCHGTMVPWLAKSGEIFYFRARSLKNANNWRSSGHMMKQQGGVPDASERTQHYSMIDRRVSWGNHLKKKSAYV